MMVVCVVLRVIGCVSGVVSLPICIVQEALFIMISVSLFAISGIKGEQPECKGYATEDQAFFKKITHTTFSESLLRQ